MAENQSRETTYMSGTTVRALLESIHLPEERVKLVMVNHKPARAGDVISADDRVAVFPSEYPFFADWKDYWQSR